MPRRKRARLDLRAGVVAQHDITRADPVLAGFVDEGLVESVLPSTRSQIVRDRSSLMDGIL